MRKHYLILFLAVIPALATDNVLSSQGGQAITVGTWLTATPTGYTAGIIEPGWSFPLQYVPAIDEVCAAMNFRELYSEYQRSMMCYSFKYNRVNVLDNGGHWHLNNEPDNGHPIGMTVDPVNSRMVGLCCNSGSLELDNRQWNWTFDFIGRSWRQQQTSSKPAYSTTSQPASTFDQFHQLVITHGGDSGFVGTSEYDPAANAWNPSVSCTSAPPATNCPPSGVILGSMAFNTFDGLSYEFGGTEGGTNYNTVFDYTESTHTWAAKTTSGTRPTARYLATWLYMPSENVFFMCCGTSDGSSQLTDSWIYDPVADTWTSLTTSGTPGTGTIWMRGAYIPEWDAIVVLSGSSVGGMTWNIFRYRPGPNVGSVAAPSVSATSGSQNRNTDSQADNPTITTDGSNEFIGWAETGTASNTSASGTMVPYGKIASGSNLGASYNSFSSSITQGSDVRFSYGSALWACWEQSVNGNGDDHQPFAATWDGSAWTGGAITGANSNDGGCSVTVIGSVPYVAFRQNQSGSIYLYVYKYSGGSWSQVGSTLNVDTAPTYGLEVSIANNGTQPCAAWSEYSSSTAIPRILVSCFNGSSWAAQGSSPVVNSSEYAYSPSLTYMGSNLYVAFLERGSSPTTLAGLQNLYVRSFNGTSWATVGSGPLNRDAYTGWAYQPTLVNDGTNLYVSWAEQEWTQSQSGLQWLGSFGEPLQSNVAKYSSGAWSYLGGSLNADTAIGSSSSPGITVSSGSNPSTVWAEGKAGALRNIYTKKWNGTDWGASVSSGSSTLPGALYGGFIHP